MMYLFGHRRARTGHFIDTEHICYKCRASDREVNLYQSYFHFCFIPCFPVGRKTVEMRCRSCGDDTRLDSVLTAHHIGDRPAWYLFSGPVLFVLLAVAWYFWHSASVKETARCLARPAVGDVYSMEVKEQGGTSYHFLRVAGIGPDSLFMLENHLDYSGFVSDLEDDDFFDSSDTLKLSRKKLLYMKEDGVLTRIQRGFTANAGFNRVRQSSQ